jgi:hypothetical protein
LVHQSLAAGPSNQLHVSAKVHFQSKFGEHGGFDTAHAMSLFFGRGVDDLDVIGFVAGHHLVAANAIKHGVHDRPLRSGLAPAAFGFFLREADNFGDAEVAMQFAVHDEYAAPDDVTWFGNAFEGSATEAEIHWRLAFAARAFEATNEMGGRRCAGDEEDPDVIIHAVVSVMLTPPEIV